MQVLRGMKWVVYMGLGSRSGLNHYRHESKLKHATYFTTLQIHSFFLQNIGSSVTISSSNRNHHDHQTGYRIPFLGSRIPAICDKVDIEQLSNVIIYNNLQSTQMTATSKAICGRNGWRHQLKPNKHR